MKKIQHSSDKKITGLVLCGAIATASTGGCSTSGGGIEPCRSLPEKHVIGYFASWDTGEEHKEIDGCQLTDINYAFADIVQGEVSVTREDTLPRLGELTPLKKLKERFPHLKTMLSIGGWTSSEHFSDIASTPESRERFAKSAREQMIQYGFQGIDIDWEFPGEEDAKNFTLLLAELRTQLDKQEEQNQTHYFLTIAASASPEHYKNIEIQDIHSYLDWINVMTYDLSGPWSGETNHHAPLYSSSSHPHSLYNADSAIQAYLSAGVPPEKINLGIPFYGYLWKNVPNINHGLQQSGTAGEAVSYNTIVQNYTLENGYQEYWDTAAKAPWRYNPDSATMITFENPESIQEKVHYAIEHQLGGVFVWHLGQDAEGKNALLPLLSEALSSF